MTPAKAECRVRNLDRRIRLFNRIVVKLYPAAADSAIARECRKVERAWGRVTEIWLGEYKTMAASGGHQDDLNRVAHRAQHAWDQAQDWAVQGDRYEARTRP